MAAPLLGATTTQTCFYAKKAHTLREALGRCGEDGPRAVLRVCGRMRDVGHKHKEWRDLDLSSESERERAQKHTHTQANFLLVWVSA